MHSNVFTKKNPIIFAFSISELNVKCNGFFFSFKSPFCQSDLTYSSEGLQLDWGRGKRWISKAWSACDWLYPWPKSCHWLCNRNADLVELCELLKKSRACPLASCVPWLVMPGILHIFDTCVPVKFYNGLFIDRALESCEVTFILIENSLKAF